MIEFPVVLVINCGSSSVKFSVLDAAGCDALMTGIADGINTEKAFISVNGGEPVRLAHRGLRRGAGRHRPRSWRNAT